MNSRLFSEVKIKNAYPNLEIEIEEKWTLIPIPAVQAGSGKSKSAGAFLFESNFLGMGMTLGLGASVSNSGSTYFGLLSDPSWFFSNWHYTLSAIRQDADVVHLYEESEIDGFHEVSSLVTLGVGYKFHPWSFTPKISRQTRTFSQYSQYTPPDDNSSTMLGASLSYDMKNYKLYYSEGLFFKSEIATDMNRTDGAKKCTSHNIQIGWQQGVYQTQALQILFLNGGVSGGGKQDALRIGGGRGLRGIEPKSLWAERFYAVAVDYQIPLKSYSYGTLTTAPFADNGKLYYRSGGQSYTEYHAFGAGVYFFLKSIAIPGLGFEAGYNSQFQKEFFAFSAGLSM